MAQDLVEGALVKQLNNEFELFIDGLTQSREQSEKENKDLSNIFNRLENQLKQVLLFLQNESISEKDSSLNFIDSIREDFKSNTDKISDVLGSEVSSTSNQKTNPDERNKAVLKNLPYNEGIGFALIINKLEEIIGIMKNDNNGGDDKGGGGKGIGNFFKKLDFSGLMGAAVALLAFAGALAIAETFGISEQSLWLLGLFTAFTLGFIALSKRVNAEIDTISQMAITSLIMSGALLAFSAAVYLSGFIYQKMTENGLLVFAGIALGVFIGFAVSVASLGKIIDKNKNDYINLALGTLIMAGAVAAFAGAFYFLGFMTKKIMDAGLYKSAKTGLAAFIVFAAAVASLGRIIKNNMQAYIGLGLGTALMSGALFLFSFSLTYAAEQMKELIDNGLLGYAAGALVAFAVFAAGVAALGNFVTAGIGAYVALAAGTVLMTGSLLLFSWSLIKVSELMKTAMEGIEGVLVGIGLFVGIVAATAILGYVITPAIPGFLILIAGTFLLSGSLLLFAHTVTVLSEAFKDVESVKTSVLSAIKTFGTLIFGASALGLTTILAIPGLTLLSTASMLLASSMLSMAVVYNVGLVGIDNAIKKIGTENVKTIMTDLSDTFSLIVDRLSSVVGLGFLKSLASVALVKQMTDSVSSIMMSFSRFFNDLLKMDLSPEKIAYAEQMTGIMTNALEDIVTTLAENSKDMSNRSRKAMQTISESIKPIVDSLSGLTNLVTYYSKPENVITNEARQNIEKNMSTLVHILDKSIIKTISDIKGKKLPKGEKLEELSSGINSLVDISTTLNKLSFTENHRLAFTTFIETLADTSKQYNKLSFATSSFKFIAKIFESLDKMNLSKLTDLDLALKQVTIAEGIRNVIDVGDMNVDQVNNLLETVNKLSNDDNFFRGLERVSVLADVLNRIASISFAEFGRQFEILVNYVTQYKDAIDTLIKVGENGQSLITQNQFNGVFNGNMSSMLGNQNQSFDLNKMSQSDLMLFTIVNLLEHWESDGVPTFNMKGGGKVSFNDAFAGEVNGLDGKENSGAKGFLGALSGFFGR